MEGLFLETPATYGKACTVYISYDIVARLCRELWCKIAREFPKQYPRALGPLSAPLAAARALRS